MNALLEAEVLTSSAFEIAGADDVEIWMYNRLVNSDSYEFMIQIIKAQSPDGINIAGKAIWDLLSKGWFESWSKKTSMPKYQAMLNVLKICTHVQLPAVNQWFAAMVLFAAGDAVNFIETAGSLDNAQLILYAATLQVSALTSSTQYKSCWRKLLSTPEFSTIALFAYGNNFTCWISYISDWWQFCGDDDKEQQLQVFVKESVQSLGRSKFSDFTRACEAVIDAWPKPLQIAFNVSMMYAGI